MLSGLSASPDPEPGAAGSAKRGPGRERPRSRRPTWRPGPSARGRSGAAERTAAWQGARARSPPPAAGAGPGRGGAPRDSPSEPPGPGQPRGLGVGRRRPGEGSGDEPGTALLTVARGRGPAPDRCSPQQEAERVGGRRGGSMAGGRQLRSRRQSRAGHRGNRRWGLPAPLGRHGAARPRALRLDLPRSGPRGRAPSPEPGPPGKGPAPGRAAARVFLAPGPAWPPGSGGRPRRTGDARLRCGRIDRGGERRGSRSGNRRPGRPRGVAVAGGLAGCQSRSEERLACTGLGCPQETL